MFSQAPSATTQKLEECYKLLMHLTAITKTLNREAMENVNSLELTLSLENQHIMQTGQINEYVFRNFADDMCRNNDVSFEDFKGISDTACAHSDAKSCYEFLINTMFEHNYSPQAREQWHNHAEPLLSFVTNKLTAIQNTRGRTPS